MSYAIGVPVFTCFHLLYLGAAAASTESFGRLSSASSYRGGRVELHVHLDGSISVLELYRICLARNLSLPEGIGIPQSPNDVQRYLDTAASWHKFDIVNNIIGGDAMILQRVAKAFGISQANSGVVYTEVRYDPDRIANSQLLNVSITKEEAVSAIEEGLAQAAAETGVFLYQILSAIRGQSADRCLETAHLASKMKSQRMGGVVGLDLAGDETDYPNTLYIHCIRFAEDILGLNITVHSGEFSAAQAADVRSAVLEMKADRVGHGYAAGSHLELLTVLRERHVHVEACPKKGQFAWDAIAAYKANGVSFGINTDDPASYFSNTSLAEVETIVEKHLNFTVLDLQMAYSSALLAAFGKRPHPSLLFRNPLDVVV